MPNPNRNPVASTFFVAAVLLLSVFPIAHSANHDGVVFYVARNGYDSWSGMRPAPNESGTDYLDAAMLAMCDLKGSVASIAVMGDHDYWSAPDAIEKRFRECRWDFLDNEHRVLEYNGNRILVTGLTHIYSQRLNEPTLDSILSRSPEADLRILLVHQPARWLIESAAQYGYHLVLAGHTHGGQIVLHPLGIPFTPSMRETPYFSGEYRLGSMSIVVTNGIGLTLAPLRYFAPAEVTTVVLAGEE